MTHEGGAPSRAEAGRPSGKRRGGAGYDALKRLLDLAVALPLLLILSPVLLATAALVRVTLGAPVLFRQVRPGRGGRLFHIAKFRTMTTQRDATGALLSDGARLTAVGRFLRRWSLDELPQLFNVVRGDLSLVGPRPLLPQYLELYTPHQARRHEVKPGITGWAQVNGRNALTWEEKFDHDVWYVDHRSLALDLRILVLTARRLLERSGIEGHGNIPFTGSGPADGSTHGGGPQQ